MHQPCPFTEYKEGGSYDFLFENKGKKYLIRPSCNYIRGQLTGVSADVLFLGITGLSRKNPGEQQNFYEETIDKVMPKIVIPIHWDNFFHSAMEEPFQGIVGRMGRADLKALMQACKGRHTACRLLRPGKTIDLPI